MWRTGAIFYSGVTSNTRAEELPSGFRPINFGNNWTNESTLSHCRSTPFTFWSHLPIIHARIHLHHKPYIYPLTPLPAHCQPLTGSAHRVVHRELGFNSGSTHQCQAKFSQPWTAHYGDRYDPQLVKRSSMSDFIKFDLCSTKCKPRFTLWNNRTKLLFITCTNVPHPPGTQASFSTADTSNLCSLLY